MELAIFVREAMQFVLLIQSRTMSLLLVIVTLHPVEDLQSIILSVVKVKAPVIAVNKLLLSNIVTVQKADTEGQLT